MQKGFGAVLLGAAISLVSLMSLIGCVSPASTEVEEVAEVVAAPAPTEQQGSELQGKVADLEAEVAALTAQLAAAQAEVVATHAEAEVAQAEAAAARTALSEAEATVMSAQKEATVARAETKQAQAETVQVQAEVDALLAAAPDPGIKVSPDQLDVSRLDLASAQVSLAGPDTIYVSSILYDGKPYSALLRYHGGTTATVERVFGPGGAMIPDSVDLSQTKLSLVAPDTLDVANVGVAGDGFSGQLRHTGGNELEVAGIQRVTLSPSAAEQIAGLQEQLAAAQAEGDEARAALVAAEAAVGEASAARAAAEAAAAATVAEARAAAKAAVAEAQQTAAAAQAKVDRMLAEAYRPSAVVVSADQFDASLLSLAAARASLAGPDTVYVSAIEYDGRSYSALLRYRGGTTATVEQVYGPRGKLIPDTVGLAQTTLAFIAPDVLDIAYVEVDGQGYSGQLRYAGGNQLEVAGIRRVALPPTTAQQVAAAEAKAAAAVAGAKATASAAVAEAQAAASAAMAEAQASAAAAVSAAEAGTAAAEAAARAALAEATAAGDAAAAAQEKVDMMLAQAYEPSAISVAAGQLIPGRLSFDRAQASLAGPNAIYVSSITYDGQSYSALLKYRGGTTATVEQVYGPRGKLIPDSVGLAQTRMAFAPPNVLNIAYVDLDGQGYSGQLRYTGGNRLEVAGIRRVTLPPTAAQQVVAAEAAAADAIANTEAAAAAAVADAQAATAAAMSEAEALAAAARAAAAAAAQARAELRVLMQDLEGRRVVPGVVDFNLLDLDLARVSVAGPESIFVSGIRYDGGEFAARLRYTGDNRGVVEALFDTGSGGRPELDLSAPAIEVLGPETMVISNVGIGGFAYSFTLQLDRDGEIMISQQEQGHRVRTTAELLRDELMSSGAVRRVVSGISGGWALPDEGTWVTSAAGTASQTDGEASHAKFALGNVRQPAVPTLYGVTVRAAGSRKVGYGLHFLASRTPQSGNTWNFGRSYLVWATRERDFYDTEATQVQLYESFDGNRLMWLNSRNLLQGLSPGLTLEALYDPGDCPESMAAPCHGSVTVLVDGMEQFKVAVSDNVARQEADTVALRALGGPLEFTELYVHSR